jgi:multimeric flavodoxin WrbA
MVLSGSLRRDKSSTSEILIPFLDGMKDAGASVTLRYVKDFKISPCMGDFHCWYTKPGHCRIKDDMQRLYPEIRKADILVLAVPVYIPLPGEMQNLLNRLCPLIEPVLVKRAGRTRARLHKDVNLSKVVLVSSCGWWEKDNMGTVARIARELAEDMSVEFSGAVLRPHASFLRRDKKKEKEILGASRRAGYELVKNGKMPKRTLDKISQPLVAESEYRRRSNESYMREFPGSRR